MLANQAQELLDRHGKDVWTLCRRLAGRDAEDLFQETFVRLVRAEVEDTGAPSTKNLLYTICLNAYRSDYAKKKRWRKRIVPMPEEYALPPAAESTERDAHRRMAVVAVHSAIASLADKYRLPIEMHYFAGWSTAQIAGALQMNESTVRSNMLRARKKLGPLLEEWL